MINEKNVDILQTQMSQKPTAECRNNSNILSRKEYLKNLNNLLW